MITSWEKAKVFICVGSGGVGKTTMASALALLAAQSGKRVLVLTIDPSKRLAQTLGIEGTDEITKVPGVGKDVELYASVINHKKTFDAFVSRAAKKSDSIAKILNNKLYQQLTTDLSASQDFSALEKLYSCYESNEFDLIVLDTPPAKHAMDFLKAPEKLSALFNEGIAKWFREPKGGGIIKNLIYSGTKQVLKALETLTGSDFIHELADFFSQIEKWQTQLEDRIKDFHRLLVSPETHFCLITSFDSAKLKEAEAFAREIRKGGHHLKTVVINRAFPEWLKTKGKFKDLDPKEKELHRLYSQLKSYYEKRAEDFESLEKRLSREVEILKLPEFSFQICDVESLEKMNEYWKKESR
jgi:anion-transporting  ArsA/GET3 family ATPase